MRNLQTSKTLISAALAATLAMPASAQKVLEEIVVLAERQESNLMETAASVSVFDAEARNRTTHAHSVECATNAKGKPFNSCLHLLNCHSQVHIVRLG